MKEEFSKKIDVIYFAPNCPRRIGPRSLHHVWPRPICKSGTHAFMQHLFASDVLWVATTSGSILSVGGANVYSQSGSMAGFAPLNPPLVAISLCVKIIHFWAK